MEITISRPCFSAIIQNSNDSLNSGEVFSKINILLKIHFCGNTDFHRKTCFPPQSENTKTSFVFTCRLRCRFVQNLNSSENHTFTLKVNFGSKWWVLLKCIFCPKRENKQKPEMQSFQPFKTCCSTMVLRRCFRGNDDF